MTASTPPDRTRDQQLAALEKANGIRFARAQLKRDIRAGKIDVADIIENPPEILDTMKVIDLILAVPHVGRIKAHKAFNKIHASQAKTVGGLTDRQREEMVRWLR